MIKTSAPIIGRSTWYSFMVVVVVTYGGNCVVMDRAEAAGAALFELSPSVCFLLSPQTNMSSNLSLYISFKIMGRIILDNKAPLSSPPP